MDGAVCGVGAPSRRCGRPAVAVIPVVASPSILSTEPQAPGIVYLCEYHRSVPVRQWDGDDDDD
jgi:hypothetical protein